MYCNFIENNSHKKVLGISFSWDYYDEISSNIIEPNYKTYKKNLNDIMNKIFNYLEAKNENEQ